MTRTLRLEGARWMLLLKPLLGCVCYVVFCGCGGLGVGLRNVMVVQPRSFGR